jgi:hypothetical protein
MADLLKFVDYEYSITGGTSGSVLLDINDGVDFCVDEILFPMPKPRYQWRDPSSGDGRDVSKFKWENREVHVRMNVFGTSNTDLSANARALWAAFLESNPILMWQADGWTDPLFIDVVSPPAEIASPDWFETWIRDYDLTTISNLDFTIEAKPFLRAPRDRITICEALGPDDIFADGETHWDPTTANGASCLIAADATFRTNGISARLGTAALAGSSASYTDVNYIAVDASLHHTWHLWAKRDGGGGNASFTVSVECFDAGAASVGTLTLVNAYNPGTAWENATERALCNAVIHPIGSPEAVTFPAGTVQVKRTFTNAINGVSTVYVTDMFFSESEYFTRPAIAAGNYANRAENPATLYFDNIKGDVPTPALLTVEDVLYADGNVNLDTVVIGTKKGQAPVVMKMDVGTVSYKSTSATSALEGYVRLDDAAGDNTYPAFSMQDIGGWYWPIIKYKRSAAGTATCTLDVLYANPYYAEVDVDAVSYGSSDRAIISGTNALFAAFKPIHLPQYGTDPHDDLAAATLIVTINVTNSTATSEIDYLAFVPMEGGILKCHDNTLDIDGVQMNESALLMREIAGYRRSIMDYTTGTLPILLYPGDTSMFFLSTNYDAANCDSPTQPYSYVNLYLDYDALYLLVPEA